MSSHQQSEPDHSGSVDLRIRGGVQRGAALELCVDGEPLTAYPGETVAVALLASGRRVLRQTDRLGEPRGLLCNMGVCFECLLEIDGRRDQRACQVPVRVGMQVRTRPGSAGSAATR